VEIAVGGQHICLRESSGTVKCLGKTVGDGSSVEKGTPTVVSGLTGVRQLAAGMRQVCALMADTTVRCWGDDSTQLSGDPNPWQTAGLRPGPSIVSRPSYP
jgi:hypothetical protein